MQSVSEIAAAPRSARIGPRMQRRASRASSHASSWTISERFATAFIVIAFSRTLASRFPRRRSPSRRKPSSVREAPSRSMLSSPSTRGVSNVGATIRQRFSCGENDSAGGATRRSDVSSLISTSISASGSGLAARAQALCELEGLLERLHPRRGLRLPRLDRDDDLGADVLPGLARERAQRARDRPVPDRGHADAGVARAELDVTARDVDDDLRGAGRRRRRHRAEAEAVHGIASAPEKSVTSGGVASPAGLASACVSAIVQGGP